MPVFPQSHQNGSSAVVQKLLSGVSSMSVGIISFTSKQSLRAMSKIHPTLFEAKIEEQVVKGSSCSVIIS